MRNHRQNLIIQGSFWSAAIAVGVIGVYFAKFIAWIQGLYYNFFLGHPVWMLFITPLGILAGVAVIRLAPMAGGSGVPQVLHAATLARRDNTDPTEQKLVSGRTAIVKVISTALGYLFGASIGIEGPMVQISTSIFAEAARLVKKMVPDIDFQSYIVAGAGTGIAAAFNAPLGGIAFAIEEVATSYFGELRHLVLLAIIIVGLTTHALAGNALYFGNPELGAYQPQFILWAILIGAIGGILGGIFGRIVTTDKLRNLGGNWWQRALIFGLAVAVLGILFNGQTGGSNYLDTRELLTGVPIHLSLLFPIGKLLATAFSTLSGLGGGILAPSLSIGAWMGVTTAKLAMLSNLKACALLGMVAYFSGAFQIPITAVIVVMEITGQQETVFPMMVAALVAHLIARLIMPIPLYHLLIQKTFYKNGTLTPQ